MEIREVFEPVLNFIKNLQKKDKETASKQAAKDRLKLVLMQDRASVSPDFFEMMKQEIIDVIKKYIEIDEESLEVELTRGLEAGLEGPALYANIPIKNVKPVAPKAEGTEDVDKLEVEVDEKVQESASIAPMTEEEADKMADTILTQIESIANNEVEDVNKEDKAEENTKETEATKNEEKVVEKDSGEEKKKTTRRKTTTTTAKKKTSTTKKATTTRKKKTE